MRRAGYLASVCCLIILGGISVLGRAFRLKHFSTNQPEVPIAEEGGSPLRSQDRPRRFDSLADAARIPRQEEYVAGTDPGPPPAFVRMSDPRSAESIVSDVSRSIEGELFRWTYLKPTLHFHVQSPERQRLVIDFGINDRTFADTGSVTLSAYVNGHFLASVHCSQPGDYHLEQRVPPAWLVEADPAVVTATLDKVWTAGGDGARLGYVLLAAGFRN
jgi:hypothetical protein